MPSVAMLEWYALKPPDCMEETEPFVLNEDNRVVLCKSPELIRKNGNNPVSCEAVRLRSMVLCRDNEGLQVFRKLLWKEFTEPNLYYPKGVWELGFSPKVIRGEQTDTALVFVDKLLIVESLIPPFVPRKSKRKLKLSV